jgi:hypothetical protein
LASRSLSVDQPPLPGASCTPAVELPAPSTAETMRVPPTARTVNWLAAVEVNTGLESLSTNAPSCVAWDPLPAAKLNLPAAVLLSPPGTEETAAALRNTGLSLPLEGEVAAY